MRTLIPVLIAVLLSACGAWQSTKDTGSRAANAVFIAKVKQMNLVIEGRAELNRDERGGSLPVAMRVYQLKDAKAFETAPYTQLLNDAERVLKADALRHDEVALGPDTTVSLKAPMAADADAVGVVAFFRDPAAPSWRLVIPKAQWKKTNPVRLSVIGNRMTLEEEAP